jgi:proline dehydrogenase
MYALAMSERFEAAAARVPGVRARSLRAARRYVAGTTPEEGLARARDLLGRGLSVSVDFFGEHVGDADGARTVADAYLELCGAAAALPEAAWLSVDLSHIGLDVGKEFCRSQLARIAEAVPPGRRLQVGAEDAGRCDAILELVLDAAARGAPLTCTLQANLRRSAGDVPRLAAAGIPVRLVKGAFVEPPARAFPYGAEVDESYLRLASALRERGVEVLAATHDPVLQEALADLPLEMLLGVHGDRAVALARGGRPVRIYAPFGTQWWRYWLRRLAEAQGR